MLITKSLLRDFSSTLGPYCIKCICAEWSVPLHIIVFYILHCIRKPSLVIIIALADVHIYYVWCSTHVHVHMYVCVCTVIATHHLITETSVCYYVLEMCVYLYNYIMCYICDCTCESIPLVRKGV